jgi:beta-glucanase (GH16 family)
MVRKAVCLGIPVVLSLACGSGASPDSQPPPEKTYALVWSEEFGADGIPSAANWTYEQGFVRNYELQWYQAGNATVQGGNLVIEARREQAPNPLYVAGSSDWRESRPYIDYTSSSLTTLNLHQWQYGRFEMRAQIDVRMGLWPAFWTLGVAGEWPSCGEIDVMEFYQGNLKANAAWGTSQQWVAEWDGTSTPLTSFGDPQWSEKFHLWRMDWDADFIRLYVDDQLLNTVDLSETVNASDGKNPFHQPHYLLLNLAVGGDAGGDPSGTTFPAQYLIDYVRVYQ